MMIGRLRVRRTITMREVMGFEIEEMQRQLLAEARHVCVTPIWPSMVTTETVARDGAVDVYIRCFVAYCDQEANGGTRGAFAKRSWEAAMFEWTMAGAARCVVAGPPSGEAWTPEWPRHRVGAVELTGQQWREAAAGAEVDLGDGRTFRLARPWVLIAGGAA